MVDESGAPWAARSPDARQSLAMLERMVLIRRLEEQLGEDFKAGNLPGTVHLYIGEEAVAVGVCAHLADSDWITSTHRGHGHFLAKGGDPKAMVAEVYGRGTGICRGMGGSMHVADVSKGILGANGIVGGGVGLSAGAALAAQLDGKGAVSVAFFGDGASTQGVLYEALNLASVWKLPLVLVCENNGYSQYTASGTVMAGDIAERARPFGVPSVAVDGNDLAQVWRAAGEAVERARRGAGPSLLEARTYRWRGHLESEAHFIQGSYRSQEEIDAWTRNDPIARFAAGLRSQGVLEDAAQAAIEQRVADTVAGAVEFARSSGFPDPAQLQDLVFAGQRP